MDTSSVSETYHYDPFRNGNLIRILVLAPGEADAPLIGSLVFVDVDDSLTFIALSYVWGIPTRSRQMLCDGKLLRITESLDLALRGIRHAADPLRLWADQVCINQDDLMERSQQVQFMSKIYECAQLVHVWLGLDKNNTAYQAFGLLTRLQESFQSLEYLSAFTETQNKNVEQFDNEEFNALRELYDLPWFQRVWICQEIGTAVPSLLQWGSVKITWDALFQVCQILDKNHRRLRVHLGMKVQRVTYLHRRFVDERGPADHRRSFACELSRGSHNLMATDPRDHVFAKLGHYSARSRRSGLPLIKADYTKSTSETYLAVASELLKEGISLEVLNGVYLISPSDDDLPSWVPRWNKRAPGWVLGDNKSVFAATSCEPVIKFDTPRALNVEGLEIDTVGYCSKIRPTVNGECKWYGTRTGPERDDIRNLWIRLSGLPDISTTARYINGESVLTAFCQAISAGCFYLAVKKGFGKNYHDTPDSQWVSHGTSYLLDLLGDTTAAAEALREMSIAGNGTVWADGANSVTDSRRVFRTVKGYYGLGPPLIGSGDIICVLFGGKTPYCLRRIDNHYVLIGECYVFGLMNGEAIDMMKNGEIQQEFFCIR